jgi:hypothetical protein
MGMPKIIGELAALLKMPVASQQNSVYSMVDGYPVQFFEAADGNSTLLWSIIRFDDPSKDALVMNAVSQSQSIAQTQLKPKHIEVAGGIVSVKWVKGITGYAKTEKILEQFVSVFNTVKSAVSGPGLKCRVCGVQEVSAPILVDGMVDRVCQACTDDIKKKSDEAQAAYDAIPVRMSYALITAAVLAVVGSAIWAASIIATQTMYWMIAILIGAGIGWATTKAAGKGARSVQVIVFTATVLSILVGMIFFIGYIVNAEAAKAGEQVNWIGFIVSIPAILMESLWDVAFSLGGGIVGAMTAASKAGRPDLTVKVDK